jgi:hypothetical protein
MPTTHPIFFSWPEAVSGWHAIQSGCLAKLSQEHARMSVGRTQELPLLDLA